MQYLRFSQCFSAETILNEANAISGKMEDLPREESLVLLLMSHLYSGENLFIFSHTVK